jgi:hypothetical protein
MKQFRYFIAMTIFLVALLLVNELTYKVTLSILCIVSFILHVNLNKKYIKIIEELEKNQQK